MEAGAPAITSAVGGYNFRYGGASQRTGGAITSFTGNNRTGIDGEGTFDASRSSDVYGKSSTVTPLSLSMICLIRY